MWETSTAGNISCGKHQQSRTSYAGRSGRAMARVNGSCRPSELTHGPYERVGKQPRESRDRLVRVHAVSAARGPSEESSKPRDGCAAMDRKRQEWPRAVGAEGFSLVVSNPEVPRRSQSQSVPADPGGHEAQQVDRVTDWLEAEWQSGSWEAWRQVSESRGR